MRHKSTRHRCAIKNIITMKTLSALLLLAFSGIGAAIDLSKYQNIYTWVGSENSQASLLANWQYETNEGNNTAFIINTTHNAPLYVTEGDLYLNGDFNIGTETDTYGQLTYNRDLNAQTYFSSQKFDIGTNGRQGELIVTATGKVSSPPFTTRYLNIGTGGNSQGALTVKNDIGIGTNSIHLL